MNIGYSTLIHNQIDVKSEKKLLSVADCIDWAPTLTNPNWDLLDESGLPNVSIHHNISAIQSLFFGVDDVSFLSDELHFKNLLNHFKKLIKIAVAYNIKYILWGSPNTRKFTEKLTSEEIDLRFQAILNLFKGTDVKLMVEAVSRKYGCEFIYSSVQLIELHNKFKCKNLGLHLDVGQMLDEKLDVLQFIKDYKSELEHIHLSTPDFSYSNKYLDLFIQVVDLLRSEKNIDCVFEVQSIESNKFENFQSDMLTLKGFAQSDY